MKRFSDFADEQAQLEGAKVKLDELINKEIEVLAFRLADSKYSRNKSGKYATIQFRENKDCPNQVFFTGSDILIEQFEKYKDEMPFLVTIRKINKYYTLS